MKDWRRVRFSKNNQSSIRVAPRLTREIVPGFVAGWRATESGFSGRRTRSFRIFLDQKFVPSVAMVQLCSLRPVGEVYPARSRRTQDHDRIGRISRYARDDRCLYLAVIPSGCGESFPRHFSSSVGRAPNHEPLLRKKQRYGSTADRERSLAEFILRAPKGSR